MLEAGLTYRPPSHCRALSTTWLVVSTPARIASSDRHCVAVALSSSLSVAGTPISYEWGGPLVLVGALTRPSNRRLF